jgi:hypothetical protein
MSADGDLGGSDPPEAIEKACVGERIADSVRLVARPAGSAQPRQINQVCVQGFPWLRSLE